MKIKLPRSFVGYILWGLAAWLLISAAAVFFFGDRLTRSQPPEVAFVETPNLLCIGPDKQPAAFKMVQKADFQRLAFKSPLSPLAASDDDKAVSYDTAALAMAPAPYAAFVVDAECSRIGMSLPITKPIDSAAIEIIDCAALKHLKEQRHYGRDQVEVIASELKKRGAGSADITARRAANLYKCNDGTPDTH
jgi:hypothetical protein